MFFSISSRSVTHNARRALAIAVAPVAAAATFACAATPAPASPLATVKVADVPHGPGMRDLGSTASQIVRLVLVLKYRNQAELDQLVAQPVGRPALTSGAFRAYFSPDPSAYTTVLETLRRAGFTIATTYPNHTIIDVTAPAPIVDRFFQTDIHRVVINDVGVRYANAAPAYLPASLSSAVAEVLGFDNIEWYRPMNRLASTVPRGSPNPDAIGQPLHGPGGGFGPLAFAWGYRFPIQYGDNGKGHAAAITIPADPSDADLQQFLKEYKIKRTGATSRMLVDGGPQNPSGGAEVEAALDYETIVGLAPGAHIDIFEFPTFSNQDVLDTYNSVVSYNLDASINSSYGACETANIFNAKAIAAIFEQGLAQGQTFSSSTGDDGTNAYGCSGTPAVSTPADTPYGVAVGGTSLITDSKGFWQAETYWDDSSGAGGGGVSKVFGAPSWQKGPGFKYSGRAIPDLSFDSDPEMGESIVFGGDWYVYGGTSLASPIFTACIEELVEKFSARPTNLFGSLYGEWHKLGYSGNHEEYAHDITTGTPFGMLQPKKGYDLATGIGSLECELGGPAYLYPST